MNLGTSRSEQAYKRWARPGFRKRVSKLMRAGANKRWNSEKGAAERLKRAAQMAERYGIPVEQWIAMTRARKARYCYKHPMVKADAALLEMCKTKAQACGLPVEEYALLPGWKKAQLLRKKND